MLRGLRRVASSTRAWPPLTLASRQGSTKVLSSHPLPAWPQDAGLNGTGKRTLLLGACGLGATGMFLAQPILQCESEAPSSSTAPAEVDEIKQTMEQGPGKYIVYARRAVQAFLTKGRLVAYTSDVGESVRPVVPPFVVRLCYGLTWGYVGVDVAYHTFEEQQKGSAMELVARTAVHATTFQVIASVAIPAFIIHQAVHAVQVALKNTPPGLVTRWVPSLCGLALIPLLPYVDEPVEHVIDMGFEKAWPVKSGHSEDKKHN
mmetsp:Transcript_62304/g.148753  ORF Transcript_62304/g.148753 Transcript_62304/m.148753 type:complete len:261 (-) Transcript_62304:132-914(-)